MLRVRCIQESQGLFLSVGYRARCFPQEGVIDRREAVRRDTRGLRLDASRTVLFLVFRLTRNNDRNCRVVYYDRHATKRILERERLK